jgi:uncharacterized membrane protein
LSARPIEPQSLQPVKRPMRSFVLVAAVAAAALSAHAAPTTADDDIAVNVGRHGNMIVVDVEVPIEATAREAWAVLTDYEHMAAFVSNLRSSAVLRRNGDSLVVEQIGEAKRGLLKFAFETVRAVELTPPREIRSTLVKGEFKSYVFSTRIVDHGSSVTVVNHGEYEPTTWVPPVVGPALIEAETRKQFGELRREVMRRKRAALTAR